MTSPQGATAPVDSDSPTGSGLGDLLVNRGLITPEQLSRASETQGRTQQRLTAALIALGFASGEQILEVLSAALGLSSTHINVYTIDPLAISALPEKVARQHGVFPLMKIDGTLLVAVGGPIDLASVDDLRFASGCRVQLVAALEQEIQEALDRYYGGRWESTLPPTDGDPVVLQAAGSEWEVRDEEAERSAVDIVERLIATAASEGASDIHVEPAPDALGIRLRVDGTFRDLVSFPATFAPALLSRIKVLGGMDIAERRLPQDGRFSATFGDRRIDLRSATYPTMCGERAVLRLLDHAALRLQLSGIGMPPELLQRYRSLTRRPEGIILITGPTGSGKTSTLYATLTELVELKKNIITIENPVEYSVRGVSQGQTHEKAGFTFAKGLRAILRQDPDIIMLGEIRDAETLQTACEASLTGHLVLSTLHTNSAVASVTRLVEMGLEPYLLASSALGFIAQRLVRRVCGMCRKPFPTSAAERTLFPSISETLWRGVGCDNCRGTGYKGRIGVFEMVVMTDELRQLVLGGASEGAMLESAKRNGTRTLGEETLAKVNEGLTTLEEVVHVSQAAV